MSESITNFVPAVSHIEFDDKGRPYIAGAICGNCGETFVGERSVCARCGNRDNFQATKLSETGTIHTYSIVHRSFPGIETPFVSAIVALDGGGSVQATVRDVSIDDPDALFNLPVKLVFSDSGQHNSDGVAFLAYHVLPA